MLTLSFLCRSLNNKADNNGRKQTKYKIIKKDTLCCKGRKRMTYKGECQLLVQSIYCI